MLRQPTPPANLQHLGKKGLGNCGDKLEDARLWSHVLSLGEQQRLAFARILLQKPPVGVFGRSQFRTG